MQIGQPFCKKQRKLDLNKNNKLDKEDFMSAFNSVIEPTIKDDLEVLEFLLGHDPLLIHWGADWEKALTKKKVKINRSKLKTYSKVIEHHRKKYNEFLAKNKNFY